MRWNWPGPEGVLPVALAVGLAAAGLGGIPGGGKARRKPGVRAEKKPARVMVVFMYPPDDVVQAGKVEDGWAKYRW